MTRQRRATMALGRSLAALAIAAVVACFAVAPVPAHAQAEQTALAYSLKLTPSGHPRVNFEQQLLYNCDIFLPDGGSTSGGVTSGGGPAIGTLDLATGLGEAYTRSAFWQVEALPPVRVRPIRFADLGIAAEGSSLFLTARVTTARSFTAASRRVRLAVMRGARIENGPLVDRRNKPVPSTFSTIATGRLTMLRAMSRALERARCKNRRRNTASRRFRSGYPIGRLTVGFRPDRAAGLAGDAEIQLYVSAPSSGDPVSAEPVAGARRQGDGSLVAPIVAGLPVPLACIAGHSCGSTAATAAAPARLALTGARPPAWW